MCMMELATNTMTADRTIESQRAVRETIHCLLRTRLPARFAAQEAISSLEPQSRRLWHCRHWTRFKSFPPSRVHQAKFETEAEAGWADGYHGFARPQSEANRTLQSAGPIVTIDTSAPLFPFSFAHALYTKHRKAYLFPPRVGGQAYPK